jgi:short-subunit dehydrogenase
MLPFHEVCSLTTGDTAIPTADARTIVVTGASSGIGRALALAAAREGYRVLIVARRAERLELVAEEIRTAGGTCATLVIDVLAPDAATRIVDAALAAFGRIDIVVNNAGTGAVGALLEQSDAAIEAQWRLHVAAPLQIARAALPHLRASQGQLVFLGSGLARVPIPNYGAYASAKAAIRAAAIQLRRELRDFKVAVTYVDPGLVDTEFHSAIGIERSDAIAAAPPAQIARAILRGIDRRSATVNAVPWQAFGTMIGEFSSTLADSTLAQMAAKPLAPPLAPETEVSEASPVATDETPNLATSEGSNLVIATTLEKALESVARRMERVRLSPTVVRDMLVPEATLELNEVAMRWAGMPNKNERAAMHEVLDALATAGYLEPMGDDTWKVLRAAD